ncbi:hypothetical protein QBC34DRAFT_335521 [Podospora aff. communis PSN243]|uniref:Zn(2)-C6 fungal-type domain-containing protein n=1 Tax=Podospora aff. communis PSN243 TaxID=3040156 RepID=A0AAV9G9I2_9PEZI|nr:hypothetical protein QBC34DRAFT_335521 [Podospora aff. communis PSN243]
MEPSNPPPIRRRMRKRKACVQCTRSKRKCDKTTPQCKRCLERGDPCEYQLLAHIQRSQSEGTSEGRSGSAIIEEESDEDDNADMFTLPSTNLHPTPESQPLPPDPNTNLSPPFQLTHTAPLPLANLTLSFLAPSSWTRTYNLDPPDSPPCARITEDDLPLFIAHLNRWLRLWLTTGHSPAMHRSLYRGSMPECIQDAFTSLAAYTSATAHTKCSILRILRDKAERLISSQPIVPNLDLPGDEPPGPQPSELAAPCVILDTTTHLARTQALFVYQLLRLFDGDIRSRAQAEEQMGTLHTWATQMLESARFDCVTAEYLVATSGGGGGGVRVEGEGGGRVNDFTLVLGSEEMTDPSATWQAWILAESVRRTFLMAEYMQSVYLTIKRGWSVCSGGVAFTPKAGLWDATGAWEWVGKARCELGGRGEVMPEGRFPRLLEGMEGWIGLKRNRHEDVDEFTHVVLGLCDTRRQWGTGMCSVF